MRCCKRLRAFQDFIVIWPCKREPSSIKMQLGMFGVLSLRTAWPGERETVQLSFLPCQTALVMHAGRPSSSTWAVGAKTPPVSSLLSSCWER